MASTETNLHPFERKGLGRAPFRFVAFRRESGGCAFCGRSIARSCLVVDLDGREFVVGTDCVRRTCGGDELLAEMDRELKQHKKQEAAARYEARRETCWSALQIAPDLLADKPHPVPWRTTETLRDEVLRLLRGTQAARMKAFKLVEAALAERASAGAHRTLMDRGSGTNRAL